MGKRLYTEVAAARHMSSGSSRGLDQDNAARPARATKLNDDRSHRRKRTIAIALSVAVTSSIPLLIFLLVFFG